MGAQLPWLTRKRHLSTVRRLWLARLGKRGIVFLSRLNGNLRMEKLAHTVGTPFSVDRSFSYDTANRLGSFSEPSKSQSFGYDAFGNLWQTGASGVPALRPNGSSWYLLGSGQVSNRLANTAYDAAGHQTQLSLTPGTTASYDAEGRVSKIEAGGSTVATYEYDADGRRVKKTVGATTTYYVYSADGQLMAEYGGTPASVGTQYLVADHLGSTRLILNAQGNCAERIDYAPFGAQLTRSGQPCYTSSTSGLPLFTGQIRDGESTAGTDTGLDYFNARYFWATLGRFTSPDEPLIDQHAMDPQSWNLYGYVRNNPLTFRDPSGKDCIYTHTLDEEAGTVLVERGSCSQKGGTYIAGSIDYNSVSYDSNSHSLDYGYTSYEGGTPSVGSTRLPDPGIAALQRGTRLAEPGVTLAATATAIVMTLPVALQAAPAIAAGGRSLLPIAATQVQNPQLQDIISRLYQVQDRIPGGTAGAIRDHLRNGVWLSNSGHFTKAKERLVQLKRLIESKNLSPYDSAFAKALIRDLKSSLGKK